MSVGADKFFIGMALMLMVVYCSQWIGYVFSALLSQVGSALLAANITWSILGFVFVKTIVTDIDRFANGWTVNYDDMPRAFKWISHFSHMRYGFEGLCINENEGLNFYCLPDEFRQGRAGYN